MIYRGHVKNGVVVLDGDASLPEGVEVVIETVESDEPNESDDPNQDRLPTLLERLKPFVGAAKGLPPDLAENHDHYIHGTPKKS